MAVYTSFALVGVGSLGSFIAKELLSQEVSLTLLTRDDTKPELGAFKQSDAAVVQVDYSDENDLRKAFSGAQVVVSTVSKFHHSAQVAIARAAKEVGVQHFVPAEFGIKITEGPNVHKKTVQDALKELQLPYTIFYAGFFAAFLHFIVSRPDLARFVARALATTDPAELAWAKIPVEGDRLSPLQVATLAEKKLGKPIEIKYIELETNPADITALVNVVIDHGRALVGTEDEMKAAVVKLFPDWNPTKYEEFISA